MVGSAGNFLSKLPSPLDFVKPSRFVRKRSMVVAWLLFPLLILCIVSVSSSKWIEVDKQETIMSGRSQANVTTTGTFSLTSYSLNIRTKTISGTFTSVDEGTVLSNEMLGSLSPGSATVLAFMIISIILIPVTMGFTFVHGWGRGDQKTIFIIAVALEVLLFLMEGSGFFAYVAVRPKSGYNLAWGAWMLFSIFLIQAILMVITMADKPSGLVRFDVEQKQFIPDDEANKSTSHSNPPPSSQSSRDAEMTSFEPEPAPAPAPAPRTPQRPSNPPPKRPSNPPPSRKPSRPPPVTPTEEEPEERSPSKPSYLRK